MERPSRASVHPSYLQHLKRYLKHLIRGVVITTMKVGWGRAIGGGVRIVCADAGFDAFDDVTDSYRGWVSGS